MVFELGLEGQNSNLPLKRGEGIPVRRYSLGKNWNTRGLLVRGNGKQVSGEMKVEYGEKVDSHSTCNLSVDPRESLEPQGASRRD